MRAYHSTTASLEQMEGRMKASRVWLEKIAQLGRHKAGNPMDPLSGRKVMNRRTGLTDGPYMEAKEIAEGYVIITASHYDEAAI